MVQTNKTNIVIRLPSAWRESKTSHDLRSKPLSRSKLSSSPRATGVVVLLGFECLLPMITSVVTRDAIRDFGSLGEAQTYSTQNRNVWSGKLNT